MNCDEFITMRNHGHKRIYIFHHNADLDVYHYKVCGYAIKLSIFYYKKNVEKKSKQKKLREEKLIGKVTSLDMDRKMTQYYILWLWLMCNFYCVGMVKDGNWVDGVHWIPLKSYNASGEHVEMYKKVNNNEKKACACKLNIRTQNSMKWDSLWQSREEQKREKHFAFNWMKMKFNQ